MGQLGELAAALEVEVGVGAGARLPVRALSGVFAPGVVAAMVTCLLPISLLMFGGGPHPSPQ